MLVTTDCKRLKADEDVTFLESPMVKRRRGVEVIKDTCIATKCEFFIGSDFSSLSQAVVEQEGMGRRKRQAALLAGGETEISDQPEDRRDSEKTESFPGDCRFGPQA